MKNSTLVDYKKELLMHDQQLILRGYDFKAIINVLY